MSKKLKEILLVDDSEATNSLNKRLLQHMEVVEKIEICLNGKEALDYLTTPNEAGTYPAPNIIFLDINMPVMDGFQFLQEYQKQDPSIKANIVVVMLTSSLNQVDANKAKNFSDVKEFFHKPLTFDQVNKLVNQLME